MTKTIVAKRVPMPEQKPKERIKNFEEIALGYSEEQALKEASRCLRCAKPRCITGCPVGNDIPAFIECILNRDFHSAIRIIKEANYLPAISGRVCRHEEQCEKYCNLGKKYESVAIGRLERFVADHERKRGFEIPKKAKPTGKKVAVIGSGPAGLTAAAYLARYGYDVTIYDAFHEPGGVLLYGIPEFRLPYEIMKTEIDFIKKLGVTIKADTTIGKNLSIKDLLSRGYSAVFIGIGAGSTKSLGIPGENLNNIYHGDDFLLRVNAMKGYKLSNNKPIKVGKKVAIIGGGHVAIDCAKCAVRMGSDVSIVYRRTESEMPAGREEIVQAKQEGIKILELSLPTRFIGYKNGDIKTMGCIQMKLGEPDESGRKRPIPIENSEFNIDVNTVVIAIGQVPDPLLSKLTPELKTTKTGTIVVDENFETSIRGVFAGGDIVTGPATVIEAVGAGKKAAYSIYQFLGGS